MSIIRDGKEQLRLVSLKNWSNELNIKLEQLNANIQTHQDANYAMNLRREIMASLFQTEGLSNSVSNLLAEEINELVNTFDKSVKVTFELIEERDVFEATAKLIQKEIKSQLSELDWDFDEDEDS